MKFTVCNIILNITWCLLCSSVYSQTDSVKTSSNSNWYDKIKIRGYAQVRYNGFFVSNPNLGCEQCDKSWGDDAGIFLRRMRVIIYGNINPRVYFYIQPDFASGVSSSNLHFGQLRDAYFDIGLDKDNEFRFRIGQSKIPFGFENLQSSQNRLPLDRNDGLNSAVANERDLGIYFMWAPKKIRQRFSMLVKDGYKGSGDYGVFAIGAYNGQTANKPEENSGKHFVARLTYPFEIKNQIFEPAIQAYTGEYVLTTTSSGVKTNTSLAYLDQRAAVSLVLYPKPFGFMAEYNIGRGPEFNVATDSIEVQNLQGGYITLNAKLQFKNQLIYPFVRGHFYDGGKKHELDARSYNVKELEIGVEWSPNKNFELVAMYTFSERRYEDFNNQNNFQSGSLLRLQAQLNF